MDQNSNQTVILTTQKLSPGDVVYGNHIVNKHSKYNFYLKINTNNYTN